MVSERHSEHEDPSTKGVARSQGREAAYGGFLLNKPSRGEAIIDTFARNAINTGHITPLPLVTPDIVSELRNRFSIDLHYQLQVPPRASADWPEHFLYGYELASRGNFPGFKPFRFNYMHVGIANYHALEMLSCVREIGKQAMIEALEGSGDEMSPNLQQAVEFLRHRQSWYLSGFGRSWQGVLSEALQIAHKTSG